MIRALLAIALLIGATACGSRDAKTDWPRPAPALWEVTAPGGQQGWLFGTIHALPDDVVWRTPILEAAIDRAGVLVVEVAELEDAARASSAFARISQSGGLPPLLARVSPAARPELAAAMKRAGMAERDFARTENWAAALMLLNSGRAQENGAGVDLALLRAGLPVVGLETHTQLFGRFDALETEDQRQLLELAANMREPTEERALVRDWLSGNLPALEARLYGDILADPELRDALLVRRNAAWLPQVTAAIEQGRRPLVAVGTAHLIDDVGLPAQLTSLGYRVRRIQ